MKIKALEPSEIADSMMLIPGWKLKKTGENSESSSRDSEIRRSNHIARDFVFSDFKTALEFTNIIGDLAETLNHHPEINLGWGKLLVSTYTHSLNGISELDLELARRIDNSFKKFSELKN